MGRIKGAPGATGAFIGGGGRSAKQAVVLQSEFSSRVGQSGAKSSPVRMGVGVGKAQPWGWGKKLGFASSEATL